MPPPQASGHRGLYMTLGALVVLAVLVDGRDIYSAKQQDTGKELRTRDFDPCECRDAKAGPC